ncbi:MAG: hypothetical protein PF542_01590, partial [Nanoarchaeota archaeon]|nr:hypothetical protein [Nanoarchaeota archaeon]
MNKLINELEKKLKIATGRLISENNMKKAPLVSPDQLQDPDYWLMGFEDSNQRDYTILAKGFNPQGYVK